MIDKFAFRNIIYAIFSKTHCFTLLYVKYVRLTWEGKRLILMSLRSWVGVLIILPPFFLQIH